MSDKSKPEPEGRVADEAAQLDASRGAPASKLALAALIISVLAMVSRCAGHLQRHSEHGHSSSSESSAGNSAVLGSLRELQEMSAALSAKARNAHGGTLTAADCDHSAYERFLAARNGLATQLDASASSMGRAQYIEINNQLMALALSTADASEALTTACAGTQRTPF